MAVYEKTFGSMSEYLDYLKHAPNHRVEQKKVRESTRTNESFCPVSWDDSLLLAVNGYPEGRDKLYEAQGQLAAMAKPVTAFTHEYDVAGMYPEIPRACAGVPDSMINIGDTLSQSKKVIKILYNRSAGARISYTTIENYGAAVLTAVDELEAAGVRVELWMGEFTKSTRGGDNKTRLLVKLKSAGDPLSLESVAFPLVHIGMFRRLGFRFIEAQPVDHKIGHNSYGIVDEVNPEDYGADVYIQALESNYNRPEAYTVVMDNIKQQLNLGEDDL